MKLDLLESVEDIAGAKFSILKKPFKSPEANLEELVEDVKQILKGYTLPLTPRTDFEFLAKFLRVKHYNATKAANSIKKYYEHINRNVERLDGIRPSDFITEFDSNLFSKLKTKVKGAKLLYVTVKDWDTTKCTMRDLNDSVAFLTEEMAEDKELQAHGATLIYHMEGLNFSHLKQCSVTEIRYLVKLITASVPFRIDAIHIVNAPWIYWTIHPIAVKLMSKKMRNRIHLHPTLESLHEFVDKDILPQSLGGPLEEEEARDRDLLNRVLRKNRPYDVYWNINHQNVK